MMCAACSPSSSKGTLDAGIHLPVLPASLGQPCAVPQLRAGQDARAALAGTRLALATCRRRHSGTVQFYADVRRNFGVR